MPVKKMKAESGSSSKSHDCCFGGKCAGTFLKDVYTIDGGRKILWALVGILLVYGIFWIGTLIRNNLQEYAFIGMAEKQERTITISGFGKVTARPDIAVTTMGMTSEAKTVAEAQEKNTQVMNTLLGRLKELGIKEEDLQTADYNVYPNYDYIENEGRILRGYQVTQQVKIKIRAIENANAVLALAGEVGANNVGGLNFTIDDKELYLGEARLAAIDKVEKKARALAQVLGVRIVRVIGYAETEGGDSPDGLIAMRADAGFGGAEAPQVESGSADVVVTAHVTFEIQ